MLRFLIYLFETGLCLSLLYLAYWLFLRKETYFNFNRLFLVGSLALTLIIPLLHLNFFIPQGSSLENPARDIERFQSAYEEMIRLIDADFGTEPGIRHAIRSPASPDLNEDGGGIIPRVQVHGSLDEISGSKISFSRILLLIYIGGVIYFLARFIYLVFRLYLLAKQNRVISQQGFRMIEIEEDISPFSFFRFLFINHASFNDAELNHVLEHEKAHIRQKHSMDHLFVHMLAVFQWFNPFAWQMRKALKSTHEYIADRQVLIRGIERIDYQALLLKQVIGYHSVELVNNFNLKPIKNRIAMMNKTRSGLPAKLKAVLVIPIALSIFFIFTDFTVKGNSNTSDPMKALNGLWIKQSQDKFSEMLYFKDGSFAYVEGSAIKQYSASLIGEGELAFKGAGSSWASKYQLSGDQLDFEWNPREEKSSYIRSRASNSLDQMLLDHKLKIDLPYISQYRLLEDERLIYRIGIRSGENGETQYTIDGTLSELEEISWRVNKVIGELSLPEMGQATGVFLVDRSVAMSEVEKVRSELREATRFRVAEGGYPHGDMELSPLLYHEVGLVRLLPPKDAKVLEKEVVEEMGGKVLTLDLTARNTTPRDVELKIQQFISDTGNNKYVISLEYDKDIPYGQYVEAVDMIYNVIYSFRNKLALEKYVVPYDQLGEELQRELRKVYPLALSETMK